MATARKNLICLEETAYYHCVSRCVRQAYLCGKNPVTNSCYEHRRQWVEDRLLLLAEVFAIDVCAYAVMSNHTHLVLHVNSCKADGWSLSEVIKRWHRIHKGTVLSNQYMVLEERQNMDSSMLKTVEETAQIWRKRLTEISWFMRSLNEFIAREANKEDECTGRFWEGRFKSQALLGEAALAACMAYVDLNPIRAKIAPTPEQSDHTSIQYRINAAKKGEQPKSLMPLVSKSQETENNVLPFALLDYISLVDMTGKQFSKDRKGVIDEGLPPIMQRLNLNVVQWHELTSSFESCFHTAAGDEECLIKFQNRQNLRHIKGVRNGKRLLNSERLMRFKW